jgi:hypothetical protein
LLEDRLLIVRILLQPLLDMGAMSVRFLVLLLLLLENSTGVAGRADGGSLGFRQAFIGKRFVNDDAPWKVVDSFSLYPGEEEANPEPFFEGKNERRKVALHHFAFLLTGKQYEDLVNATNGLVLDGDGTDSFQMAWLRCSVSRTKKIPAGVRNNMLTLECFAAGSFAGDSFDEMEKTLTMSKKRKDGSKNTRGLREPKLILFRLDVEESTMDGSAALVKRLCSS